MTEQQKNDFLHKECVIMATKYLNIIGGEPVFLDQLDSLNTEIAKISSDIIGKLENFQNIYEKWFKMIFDNKKLEISEKDIEVILEKDKAREVLSQACIQYHKVNNLPKI